MTSKNFSTKYLVRQNLTSRMWAIALGILGCLAGLLLPVFVIQQGYRAELEWIQQGNSSQTPAEALSNAQGQIGTLLSLDNPFIKLVLIVLAILCGVSLFRYLHDRRQVDFFHALPVNRGKLFVLNYMSGVLLVIPVYLIILLIAIACAGAMGFAGGLHGGMIVQGMLGNLAYFLLNYTVAVLCTILTGNTIITVLLGVWAEFGITLLMIMVQVYQAMFYQTFATGMPAVENLMMYGSPIGSYLLSGYDQQSLSFPVIGQLAAHLPGGMGALLYPVVLTIVLLALSFVLFCRRRSENSGMAIAFKPFQPPLKWFMCLVSGLAFSLIFTALFNRSSGWRWFGLVFGVVLCHMVVEIVYDFDFKALLHHWKQMILVTVLAILLLAGIQNDVLGYDRYVPDVDDIASVAIEDSMYTYMTGSELNDPDTSQLTDADSIALVHEIAERSVQNLDSAVEDEPVNSYTVHYTLKNGTRAARNYYSVRADVVKDQIIALVTSPAYLERYSTLQNIHLPDGGQGTSHMELRNSICPEGLPAQRILTEREDIQAVIDTLRKDQMANAEAHLQEVPVLSLSLYNEWRFPERDPNERNCYGLCELSVYPSDTASLALIEQMTGLRPAVLSHENVQSIDIVAYTEEEYQQMMESSYRYGGDQVFIESHTMTVTDAETIDALLENAVTQSMRTYSGPDIAMQSFEGSVVISAKIVSRGLNATWTTDEQIYYPEGQAPTALLAQLGRTGEIRVAE